VDVDPVSAAIECARMSSLKFSIEGNRPWITALVWIRLKRGFQGRTTQGSCGGIQSGCGTGSHPRPSGDNVDRRGPQIRRLCDPEWLDIAEMALKSRKAKRTPGRYFAGAGWRPGVTSAKFGWRSTTNGNAGRIRQGD